MLIDMMEQREFLYELQSHSHSNRGERAGAMKELVEKLGMTCESIKMFLKK